MLENTPVSEELTPSAEQVERAEVLVEGTLEAAPESEVILETTPESATVELEEATVVETKEVAPDLNTNLEPEAVPEDVLQSVKAVDSAQIINDARQEAIANFETGASPTIDVNTDALTGVPEAALSLKSRADLTILPPTPGIFSQGTAEDDLLFGTPGDDFLLAGGGDDIVIGLPGRDLIFGEADNDFLIGGTGNDVIDGGTGDDLIFGDDSRTAPGDGGADIIRGGDGLDVVFAGGNNDTVFGDGGDDVIYGESGKDVLNGGNGADLLNGGDGSDRLFGDSGNDLLNGGAGDDRLNAEDGDDLIIGGAGNDAIFGGRGNDTIAGVDTAAKAPGFGEIDTLRGGAGSDLFQLGDAEDFYYDEGTTVSPGDDSPFGFDDYGLIADFAIGEDLIQLNGSADQYVLQQAQDDPFNTNNLPTGTAIYRLTPSETLPPFDPKPFPEPILLAPDEQLSLGSTDESLSLPIPVEPDATIELVGVVQNVDPSQLSLDDGSQFTFV